MLKKLTRLLLIPLLAIVMAVPLMVIAPISTPSTNELISTFLLPVVRLHGESWKASGVIVWSKQNIYGSYDSLVLTDHHCVAVSEEIHTIKEVEVFDGNGSYKVSGIVLQQSPNNLFGPDIDNMIITTPPAGQDLALILINTDNPVSVAKIMSRDKLNTINLLDDVIAVGCSLGGKPRLTKGQITLIEKEYTSINALFAPGSSGGSCYDANGYLIGITNAGIPNYNWMGVIRGLSSIYDWLDSCGYSFIYDNTQSFSVIEKDKKRVEKETLDRLSKVPQQEVPNVQGM